MSTKMAASRHTSTETLLATVITSTSTTEETFASELFIVTAAKEGV